MFCVQLDVLFFFLVNQKALLDEQSTDSVGPKILMNFTKVLGGTNIKKLVSR